MDDSSPMDSLSPVVRSIAKAGPISGGRRPLHAIYRAPEGSPVARLGVKTPLVVILFYLLIVVGATYPRVTMLKRTLPGSRVDALQHIWVMNWYKSCLLEGKSHVFCPDIQYPTGAPLANFSPMLFQTLLFLPLSAAFRNDIFTYNIIWYGAFVFSGFSVFWLAWTVLRDRLAATFAGLAGMLCAPMMLRGHGHLELMFAGSMCLFLASWIGWVDRPRRSGLFATAGLYSLSALCAAYFAVFAVVPAVLYVAGRMVGAGRVEAWPWLRPRVKWFAGFLALVVPALALIFSAQIWAMSRGMTLHRPLSEYARYGSPIWSYVYPTIHHALASVFAINAYDPVGYPEIECASYLGVVTLLLIGYSAIRRVSFAGSRYFWLTFGVLGMLSVGAYLRVGSYQVPMPGLWLHQYVPIFQAIRAPSRFNLLACGIAAVLAGSGLSRLLSGFRTPWARGAIFAAAGALLVADLRLGPFPGDVVGPGTPRPYSLIRERNPHAAMLELPLLSSDTSHAITATCAYWQSEHGMRTSAGYSGFPNAAFDDLLVDDSPLSALSMIFYPGRLARPDSLTIGVVRDIGLMDYTWMVANRARFDYIVVHRWHPAMDMRHPGLASLIELLREAMIFEGPNTLAFDVAKLPSPRRPTLFCEGGWRAWRGRKGPPLRAVEKRGQVALYIPEGSSPTSLTFEARAHRRGRRVALREGDVILARWEVAPDQTRSFSSPPLALPAGMHALVLESDAEVRPRGPEDQSSPWDVRPYSLLVSKLELRAVGP